MSLASSLPAQNRSTAFAMLPTVGASAKKPVTPSSMTSECPATSVAITGHPQQHGFDHCQREASNRDGMTKMWFDAQISSTLLKCPAKLHDQTDQADRPSRRASRSPVSRFGPSHITITAKTEPPTTAQLALETGYPALCGSAPICQHRRTTIWLRALIGGPGQASRHNHCAAVAACQGGSRTVDVATYIIHGRYIWQ